MTKTEMAGLMERIFAECMGTREEGQKEYAHDESNAFANFERAATDLGLDRTHVLWIFAMKHRDGIVSWLNGHRSQREDVRGRIKDLIVYLCLLWGMIDEEEPTPEQTRVLEETYAAYEALRAEQQELELELPF